MKLWPVVLKFMVAAVPAALLAQCSDLPCMKSYQFHEKANFAANPSEKAYYEEQARIYDEQCAAYNDRELKKRQDEESRRHR